jgi:hypothetical protein
MTSGGGRGDLPLMLQESRFADNRQIRAAYHGLLAVSLPQLIAILSCRAMSATRMPQTRQI